uniref:Uncharacterized protein n=1 Tax=Candidatus Kentrum sp. LPFa TaxID=2126335 RepID=A0A450Y4H7_9GAMM|nr:MAG: hypothetical protein BECKLPF1236A_GA0070988_104962 [Candidatus Kentron sp. LPFa]VFK36446.1 MAG: hypothetical protein BECKLPF1236C_GA0070990_106101 [Candidatus Kentron sp. LPFa]
MESTNYYSVALNANSILDLVCFDDVIISGRSMQDYLFDKKTNETADSLIDAMRKGKVRLTILVFSNLKMILK